MNKILTKKLSEVDKLLDPGRRNDDSVDLIIGTYLEWGPDEYEEKLRNIIIGFYGADSEKYQAFDECFDRIQPYVSKWAEGDISSKLIGIYE